MPDTRKTQPAYFEGDEVFVRKHKNAIRAVQAVWSGTANEGQQIQAMIFIVDVLCNRAGNQYYTSQRDTDFALGRKFVGDHIASAVKLKLGKIEE